MRTINSSGASQLSQHAGPASQTSPQKRVASQILEIDHGSHHANVITSKSLATEENESPVVGRSRHNSRQPSMVVARNAVNFNPSKQSRDGMNQSQFSEMAASGHSATAMEPKAGTVGGSGVLNSIESHSRQGIDLFKASDIRIPGINDSRLANKDSRPANKTLLYGNSVMSS